MICKAALSDREGRISLYMYSGIIVVISGSCWAAKVEVSYSCCPVIRLWKFRLLAKLANQNLYTLQFLLGLDLESLNSYHEPSVLRASQPWQWVSCTVCWGSKQLVMSSYVFKCHVQVAYWSGEISCVCVWKVAL